MQISVTARNMEITTSLKAHAENRVQRLTRHCDFPIIEAHVILSIQKYRHFAEINLLGKSIDIHGTEETTDMYLAIDKAVEKVEKQLKKHKDRFIALKSKQRERNHLKRPALESSDDQQQPFRPQIIKTHRYITKPMSIEEAVMQMDVLGKDFIMFQNSETDEVNVIHRKEDGNFDLIEPVSGEFEEEEEL